MYRDSDTVDNRMEILPDTSFTNHLLQSLALHFSASIVGLFDICWKSFDINWHSFHVDDIIVDY